MGQLMPLSSSDYRQNESMAKHTSWRVGGVADVFYSPANLDDLVAFIQQYTFQSPLFWLGLGSNVLVRDGGIRGTVIATRYGLSKLHEETGTIYAEVGVSCAKVARLCDRLGGDNLAFLAGIPGTVGGALAMNAGAFGSETWENVLRVAVINQKGIITIRSKSDFQVGYRQVDGLQENESFVGVWLQLEKADTNVHKISELLSRRQQKQPIGLPSSGSVFKNPPNDYAGRLIEAAGLKGYQMGDAQISPKHANFIINLGQATAWDIESLINHAIMVVQQQQDVVLQPEVRIVGEYLANK